MILFVFIIPTLVLVVLTAEARTWTDTKGRTIEADILRQRFGLETEQELTLKEIDEYRRIHPNVPADLRATLDTQWHARWAAPWTCLVVVLLALPFGAMTGRRNVFMGVAGSIFVFFAFFALSQTCLALGTSGLLPPVLAGWLPNLLFTTLGVTLIFRAR